MFTILFTGQALATDLPRVLIVGEDADQDTIPRDSRVFKRVLNGIANTMINQGFDVKDETALTHETHTQGRTRRDDAELIEIAKDTGIDILCIFSIYPNAHSRTSSLKVTTRIEGRLLSVNDGSRLGNFEHEPQQEQLVPKPYSRDDILEAVGKLAKIIGEEVGDYLATRLSNYESQPGGGRLQEWTLIFDGFTLDEITEMEKILAIFTGYDSHRPKSNSVKTNLHHEYWYKSSIDSAKMEQNMHKLLKKFNHDGRIYMNGLEVSVKKAPKPIQKRTQQDSEW
jgi:hypothetical protein